MSNEHYNYIHNRMARIVLLKVVTGITPLDHVSIGDQTAEEVWREICGGNPNDITSVLFRLPQNRIVRLRSLVTYRNRGGISNADLKRWIIDYGLDIPGTNLVFEVSFNEDTRSVEYLYKGVLR